MLKMPHCIHLARLANPKEFYYRTRSNGRVSTRIDLVDWDRYKAGEMDLPSQFTIRIPVDRNHYRLTTFAGWSLVLVWMRE